MPFLTRKESSGLTLMEYKQRLMQKEADSLVNCLATARATEHCQELPAVNCQPSLDEVLGLVHKIPGLVLDTAFCKEM